MMTDPFLVQSPAAISFSGGRTSGYMLWRILQAYGGELPENVVVTFANTGKEREQTLRFVHECGARWNVKINWIEWRPTVPGFEVIGYNSAARLGEPFSALIAKKGMPPNWQARFCTEFLKVRAMTAFLATKLAAPYAEVIGLRYDEGHRVLKMLARNEDGKRRCVAPLSTAKVTEADVRQFWRAQPFDLGLEPGEGNCDLCFLKGRGIRKELIRRDPASADWWIGQEQSVNGFFDRRDSYSGLLSEVRKAPDLFSPLDDEHDVECGLLCEAT